MLSYTKFFNSQPNLAIFEHLTHAQWALSEKLSRRPALTKIKISDKLITHTGQAKNIYT